ncbi:hypothetical protein LCGC14_1488450, partial [marine sediment metagenome]
PPGMVATPGARAAPVYTMVIDLRHLDAADVALLFGGRFLVGRTSMRYGYSRGYGGRGYSTQRRLRPYERRKKK